MKDEWLSRARIEMEVVFHRLVFFEKEHGFTKKCFYMLIESSTVPLVRVSLYSRKIPIQIPAALEIRKTARHSHPECYNTDRYLCQKKGGQKKEPASCSH